MKLKKGVPILLIVALAIGIYVQAQTTGSYMATDAITGLTT